MSRGSDIRSASTAATKRSAAKAARVITMAPVCENGAKRFINNNHNVNLLPMQRALINRNYAKLWYGQAVSAVGDCVFGTTLVLWVSQVLASGRSWPEYLLPAFL